MQVDGRLAAGPPQRRPLPNERSSCYQVLGLAANLLLRRPETANAAMDVGCLDAALEAMTAMEALQRADPSNMLVQWAQRQVELLGFLDLLTGVKLAPTVGCMLKRLALVAL